jgi:hypothetical protein
MANAAVLVLVPGFLGYPRDRLWIDVFGLKRAVEQCA